MYWRVRPLLKLTSIRELVFIGMGIHLKTSEYLDILALRGLESAVTRALVSHLTEGDANWDRIWLHQVPSDSPMLPHLVNAFTGRVGVTRCDSSPYIDTSATWDDVKSTFGPSMRRNVEYYPRRLRRTHNIDFQLATTPDAVDRGMDHLVRLHQARWTARGETGAFAHPSLEGFLRQTAHHALRHGGTRLWTLALDGTVQAALLGFLDAGVLHYFQQGFNPQFATYGLGNVMLALCVRACCSDPEVRAFDFMGGGAPYKHLWARKSRNTVCLEDPATELARGLVRRSPPPAWGGG